MALVLIVLSAAEARSRISSEVEIAGHDVIRLATWDEVLEGQGTSHLDLDAVVFKPEKLEAAERVGWKHGFASLRDTRPELIGISLADTASPWRASTRLPAVCGFGAAIATPRVAHVLARELASRETKRVLDQLHARVLGGDDQALNEFCRRIFTEVRGQLVAKTPREDRDLIETAVDNALLKYVLQPRRYDPSRGHPIPFIKKIAMDSLIDMGRVRQRRSAHEVTVGLDLPDVSSKADSGLPGVERQIHLAEQRHLLMSAARSHQERAFVTAWLEGSTTTELAQILSLHYTPDIEQKTAVHATKARLRKRARLAVARRRRAVAMSARHDRARKKTSLAGFREGKQDRISSKRSAE